jgi:hypothetical protein
VKSSTTSLSPALAVLMQSDVTPFKEATFAAITALVQNNKVVANINVGLVFWSLSS